MRARLSQFDRIARGTNRRTPSRYMALWERYEDDPEGLQEKAKRIRQRYHADGFLDGEGVASDIAEPGKDEAGADQGDAGEPGPAPRVEQKKTRIIRDTALAKEVKAEQNYCCQLCSTAIRLVGGVRYAEAHHVKPLGSPHDGPDVRENIICVCPNCHAKLDFGAVRLKVGDHDGVGETYVRYHNEEIAEVS